MSKGWYVVHTFSGHEQKIEKLVRRQMEIDEDFASVCSDVKVPFEVLVENKDGKKKESKHKVLPGYILVEMDLPEGNSWKKYCDKIRSIQGVTGFLTTVRFAKPLPLSKEEVENILQKTGELQAEKTFKPKQNFAVGDNVKVTDGPFAGFVGFIEEINAEKSRIRVTVEIFGRATPVDIEYSQVEKV